MTKKRTKEQQQVISEAMKLLRAIPSERRSEQSRINGRKGGRPRKNRKERNDEQR